MKTITVDLLVAGSGAAGLTAAVTARLAGLDVLVVEKEAVFGGTTATSGGVLWVPGNHHSPAVQQTTGIADSIDDARAYLIEETGNHIERERVETYLDVAPRMVRFLEDETEVKFYGMDYPDYHSESAYSSTVRSIGTVDYEARRMGKDLARLKNQLPQTLFMGFAVGSGVEMIAFMKAGRSIRAAGFVAKKLGKHFLDIARYGEGQQVVRGRALVARLARSLFDLGTPLWTQSPLRHLVSQDGRIVAADVETADGPVRVEVRRGVVLACGGFPQDPERRAQAFPAPAGHRDHRNPAAPGNTGDGTRLAESVGGTFSNEVSHPAAWMPVSVLPESEDFTGVWPHLVDRQKPGFISVTADGKRFCDESSAYHDYVPELIKACAGKDKAEAWLVGDAAAVRKWGIGLARPFPIPHGNLVRSGYLKRAESLRELATACGIDPAGLEATVARFNAGARAGVDPEFGRGDRVYDRYQGDPEHGPNPCLGPLEQAPFYAVRIEAGIIGTFAGLMTDSNAQVLRADGTPIEGLYAVGNDQKSVFAGAYPGAGATLGPAMTFGYIAGRHAAGLPA
ncbi:FAD-dependent oxidoreductase [Croceicoccus sp. BE223]|uniref:FAD-dependent oxidoreductase n=1 Tax=Croceicoccus sp. BE223 TaxID=2817716 RepID=UPI00285AC39C|nr:FAD-dependent oxidoreductase [Croceicoccus sp. BE223]MDR7103791.1 succinate dehydrogenase/fumarate reductase flavoprotein subunit [Croceicoccus sp. BE223]